MPPSMGSAMTSEPKPADLHRRLPGYTPTRLVELSGVAVPAAARVFIKLETHRFGLPSFKVLGASWAVANRVAGWLGADAPSTPTDLDALRGTLDRRGRRPMLVAATDGNHGRAVAWSAARLGCPAQVFVPAGTAEARRAAIAGEGATVHVVDGDYDETVVAAARRAREDDDTLLVQDTAVPGIETGVARVVEGYTTIFEELAAQLPAGAPEPLVLVVPVGVGSLAVAVGEDADTLEEVHEPFLIQSGFLHRTPRGRVATDRAYRHLGLARPPGEAGAQGGLFEG